MGETMKCHNCEKVKSAIDAIEFIIEKPIQSTAGMLNALMRISEIIKFIKSGKTVGVKNA